MALPGRCRCMIAASCWPATASPGLRLLDPDIALSADKTLTIALPNNSSTMDPIQRSNHDGMAVSNAIFGSLLEVDLDRGAPAESLHHPQHPYTRLLLDAIPRAPHAA